MEGIDFKMLKHSYPKETIKNVKNIIFDMDGTLVNTAKATIPACQESAVKFGLPVKQPDEIAKMIGWANPEFYLRLYPDFNPELIYSFAEETEIKEKRMIEEMGAEILFPGVRELLEYLKLQGCYLAIASTGSLEHVETSLKVTGIYDIFDTINCGESEKGSMVKRIIEGGPSGEWLILGDKSKDSHAGRINEIITVAARYGFGFDEEYEQFNAGIDKPLELLDLLGYEYAFTD